MWNGNDYLNFLPTHATHVGNRLVRQTVLDFFCFTGQRNGHYYLISSRSDTDPHSLANKLTYL